MDELLAAIKNYLDITWEDPEGDIKLSGIISRGKQYINRIAGSEQIFSEEQAPRGLLFDYVRYARSNALDEFEKNYKERLVALQVDCEVSAYDSKQDEV